MYRRSGKVKFNFVRLAILKDNLTQFNGINFSVFSHIEVSKFKLSTYGGGAEPAGVRRRRFSDFNFERDARNIWIECERRKRRGGTDSIRTVSVQYVIRVYEEKRH